MSPISLDLGAVVGRVVLEDVEFQRTYVRVSRQMADLGSTAGRAAAGTGALDEGLGAVSASADKAAVGLGRASKAAGETSASEDKAAAAASRHAKAVSDVALINARYAGESAKVQQAALRDAAAQQRLAGASTEAGSAARAQAAETARLASAQASAIGSSRSLAAAQKETAVASRGGLFGSGGALGMAKDLGLIIGAIEAFKVAVDIGKQAADFQQKMLLIKTSAGASSAEVARMSSAVLAMAPQVATSPDKLADALYHVEQNGLRGQAALDALRVGAEGAKIGMADVEDTTNTMTIAMASGIKGVGNLQQAMGFMIATVGTGDMRLKDLNEALGGGILSTAKGFGVSLRDVAAVLATLGDNGIRGANAATALRMTMMGFAAPMKGGAAALADVGLKLHDLRDAMEKHGLVYAMNDLEQHMKAAGVTGGKVGAFITQAFGKRAGAGVGVLMGEIDRLNIKNNEALKGAATFADRWKATTQTVAFQFSSLGARIDAAGVKLATSALPLASVVGKQLGGAVTDIIRALSGLGAGLGVVFKGAGALIGGAAYALHGVAAALAFLAPVIKVVGGAALAMFAAFKGYQLVRAAAFAIMDGAAMMSAGMKNAATSAATSMGFMERDAGIASATIQADLLAIGVAASEEAATLDRAAANLAESQLAAARAVGVASDTEIAALEAVALAAQATAAASAESAAAVATAADAAAADVVVAGDAARAGWVGLAGPLGLAAIGVLSIVSMFHKSSTASKEATDAAKSYTDVLTSGGSKSDLIDAITKQLSDNKLPETLAKLNSALGKTAFTGKQFTDAIQNGNPSLGTLRDRLEAIVKAGTQVTVTTGRGASALEKQTPAAKAAAKALGDLNAQYDGLTTAVKKDLLDTKAFAGVSSSIDKVSLSTHVASKTAQTYAEMLGISVDKNGVAAVSAATLAKAVSTVSTAYNTATTVGDGFLKALDTFSKSGGTAADRAALIGATLKAANGDALSFAGAMNAGASASAQLATDMASAAKSVGKSGVSVSDFIASIVNLKTGTIDYSKSAAAPLINDLTSMQTAAMTAASAMYQHELSTKGAKKAADDAYVTFHSLTAGALVAQARQLGLTRSQAEKLATQYFGMPKNVKTLIEQEGANPVVAVLNKIGALLAFLVGKPWNPAVGITDNTPAPLSAIDRKMRGIVDRNYTATINVTANIDPAAIRAQNLLNNLPGSSSYTVTNKSSDPRLGFAAGGTIPPNTRFTVGEEGWEGGVTDSQGRATIFSHPQSVAMGYKPPVGYASGTAGSLASFLASLGLSTAGIAGVLGNAQIESSMNLRAYNPNENAHGLFQWEGGRWTGLQNLARSLGVGSTSETAQFAMLKRELASMPGLLHTLQTTGSAGSAAAAFDQIFERSSGSSRGARVSAAQSFMSQLASGHLSGGTSGPSTSGLVSAAAAFGKLIGSGRDHTKGVSATQVVGDMEKIEAALQKAGASSGLINKLTKQNQELSDAAAKRNHAASMLANAQKAVANALQTRATDTANFKATGVGIFDITTAGADANGNISAAGLRSAQQQDVTKIRKWSTDMGRLMRLGIFPTSYLRQLFGKGPDALPTVDAILGMSTGDLKAFAVNERTIDSLAGSIATSGAKRLDDPAIIADQKAAKFWDGQVSKMQHAIEHVGAEVEAGVASALGKGMKAHMDWSTGTLTLAVRTDAAKSAHRKPTR